MPASRILRYQAVNGYAGVDTALDRVRTDHIFVLILSDSVNTQIKVLADRDLVLHLNVVTA